MNYSLSYRAQQQVHYICIDNKMKSCVGKSPLVIKALKVQTDQQKGQGHV